MQISKEEILKYFSNKNVNNLIIQNNAATKFITEIANNIMNDYISKYEDKEISLDKTFETLSTMIDSDGNFHYKADVINNNNLLNLTDLSIYVDHSSYIIIDSIRSYRFDNRNQYESRKYHQSGIQVSYRKNSLLVERDDCFVTATVSKLSEKFGKKILGKWFTHQIGLIEEDGGYNRTEEGGLLLNFDILEDVIWKINYDKIFINPPENDTELSLIQTEILLTFINFIKYGIQSGKSQILSVPEITIHKKDNDTEVPLMSISQDILNSSDDEKLQRAIRNMVASTKFSIENLKSMKIKYNEFLNYCISTGLLFFDNNKELKINFKKLCIDYEDFNYELDKSPSKNR